VEVVNGTPIVVLPGVFNPKLLRTGALLVEVLDGRGLCPEANVLDLGTGSGIGAVFAGRRARRVVAVDVNPEAARCARINRLLHHLEERVEVREGDLVGPVGDERFDLILFNPPFYRGEPRDALDRAWRSPDAAERFAARLGDHLTAKGEALVILSSDGDAATFLNAFHANQLTVLAIASCDLVNEMLTVYRVGKHGQ
jgi:release factor glutamine methyltransferase